LLLVIAFRTCVAAVNVGDCETVAGHGGVAPDLFEELELRIDAAGKCGSKKTASKSRLHARE
jgi:hypothetical protein